MSELVAQKVEIKEDDTLAPLDLLEARIRLLRKTRDEIREMQAFEDQVEEEVRAELLKRGATVGTIKGVPVFTWRPAEQYAWAKLRDKHPEIYEQYVEPKTTDVLNKAKLLADHPGLVSQFQTRRLEYV